MEPLEHHEPHGYQRRVNAVVALYAGFGLKLIEKVIWQQFMELQRDFGKKRVRSERADCEWSEWGKIAWASSEIRIPLRLVLVKNFDMQYTLCRQGQPYRS